MSKKKLFVISDLHLGGDEGFQMCSNQESLAEFIESVTTQVGVDKDTEFNLVLAGDIIDFLAEMKWSSFTHSEKEALKKIDNVFENFSRVFLALREYVASGARLTILLGNHDVEMSLPKVRRHLLDTLGRGSIEFLYDNEAFVVGDEVLIEHGNRYDSWNALDYDSLRQIRSLLSRHQDLGDILLETPGSVFVTTVMNDLKTDYAFIDLFKPETLAVVLLISALEPKKIFSLQGAETVFLQGLLKAVSLVKPTVYGQFINQYDKETHMPKQRSAMAGQPAEDDSEKRQFEKMLVEIGFDPESVAALKHTQTGQMSGRMGGAMPTETWGDYARNTYTNFSAKIMSSFSREENDAQAEEIKLNRIFKAFKYLAQTEKASDENEYVKAAKHLTKKFKVVIFGHTHKALRKEFTDTGGVYLNSGTWADVIVLEDGLLDKDNPCDKFREFIGDLKSNKPERLNKYRKSRGTFVEINLDENDKLINADVYFFEGKNATPTLIK